MSVQVSDTDPSRSCRAAFIPALHRNRLGSAVLTGQPAVLEQSLMTATHVLRVGSYRNEAYVQKFVSQSGHSLPRSDMTGQHGPA